jgi:uncharacterized membrane protein YfcA
VAALIPPELGSGWALALIAASFLTSAVTGALGLGGGVLMLALLATLLPPLVVLPVHGLVQIGSNLGRAVLMRRAVVGLLFVPFALGTVAGVALAAPLVVALPTGALLAAIALFVLWAAWGKGPRPADLPPPAFAVVGAVTGFLSMFVGVTGPLLAAFLAPERLGRHGVVATHAACMTVQHGLKVAAFVTLGFAFLPWLPVTLAMIATGFAGTVVGKRLLDRMPERRFALAFRLVLTALALLLLRDAAGLAAG